MPFRVCASPTPAPSPVTPTNVPSEPAFGEQFQEAQKTVPENEAKAENASAPAKPSPQPNSKGNHPVLTAVRRFVLDQEEEDGDEAYLFKTDCPQPFEPQILPFTFSL